MLPWSPRKPSITILNYSWGVRFFRGLLIVDSSRCPLNLVSYVNWGQYKCPPPFHSGGTAVKNIDILVSHGCPPPFHFVVTSFAGVRRLKCRLHFIPAGQPSRLCVAHGLPSRRKNLAAISGGQIFRRLVEARGVEPRSWRNCPMFSTCLAWAFVFSRRLCAMQTTAGAADLFFLAGGIRLPDAPGQPDVCASSRIRHQGRDVTGYAASAYSVFAVTFLTDDLGGQRSSSACLHRSASSVETFSPPDFKEQIPGGRHTLILLNRHLT